MDAGDGEEAERQHHGRNKADHRGRVKETDVRRTCEEEGRRRGQADGRMRVRERGVDTVPPPLWQGAVLLLFSCAASVIMHVGARLSGSGSCECGALSSILKSQ